MGHRGLTSARSLQTVPRYNALPLRRMSSSNVTRLLGPVFFHIQIYICKQAQMLGSTHYRRCANEGNHTYIGRVLPKFAYLK